MQRKELHRLDRVTQPLTSECALCITVYNQSKNAKYMQCLAQGIFTAHIQLFVLLLYKSSVQLHTTEQLQLVWNGVMGVC